MEDPFWNDISCTICQENLFGLFDIAVHPPVQEWSNRPPGGRRFMHEQCREQCMEQCDTWSCPVCRACLQDEGYARSSMTSRGAVLRMLIKHDFWRDQPPPVATTTNMEVDDDLLAALRASQGPDETQALAEGFRSHDFLFWDNVVVSRTTASSHNEGQLPSEEHGCVPEICETLARAPVYRTMQSEWFVHSELAHLTGQESYWAQGGTTNLTEGGEHGHYNSSSEGIARPAQEAQPLSPSDCQPTKPASQPPANLASQPASQPTSSTLVSIFVNAPVNTLVNTFVHSCKSSLECSGEYSCEYFCEHSCEYSCEHSCEYICECSCECS